MVESNHPYSWFLNVLTLMFTNLAHCRIIAGSIRIYLRLRCPTSGACWAVAPRNRPHQKSTPRNHCHLRFLCRSIKHVALHFINFYHRLPRPTTNLIKRCHSLILHFLHLFALLKRQAKEEEAHREFDCLQVHLVVQLLPHVIRLLVHHYWFDLFIIAARGQSCLLCLTLHLSVIQSLSCQDLLICSTMKWSLRLKHAHRCKESHC